VYALQKFRIYVVGHSINVYSDNKALSFLKKCNLTSGRITRWVLSLQEYDLKIIHISGKNNYFPDVLSQNTNELTDNPRRPNEILMSKLEVYQDLNLKRELDNLAEYQHKDPKLLKISEGLTTEPNTFQEKYMVKEKVLYCKDNNKYQHWRIMLPSALQTQIFRYVIQVLINVYHI
jgi:hypothetical protein